MFEFFDNIAPENEEQVSEIRADKIKASVLSRIDHDKEEKPMKKHFGIKSLIIAAAVAVTGAASVVTANAAANGAIINTAKKHLFFSFGDNEYAGTATVYKDADGNVTEVKVDIPDDIEGIAGVVVSESGELDDFTVTPIDYISAEDENGELVDGAVWVTSEVAQDE